MAIDGCALILCNSTQSVLQNMGAVVKAVYTSRQRHSRRAQLHNQQVGRGRRKTRRRRIKQHCLFPSLHHVPIDGFESAGVCCRESTSGTPLKSHCPPRKRVTRYAKAHGHRNGLRSKFSRRTIACLRLWRYSTQYPSRESRAAYTCTTTHAAFYIKQSNTHSQHDEIGYKTNRTRELIAF